MHAGAGLWWTALFVGAIGGTAAYLLARDRLNPDAAAHAGFVFLLTAIGVGVCIIAATANWWVRR